MSPLHLLSAFLLLIACAPANAETTSFDSKFVTIKPWVATAGYGYDIKDADTQTAALNWKPNTRATSGVDIYIHGWFGFGIGGLGELKSEDRLIKGDTNYSDYRFSFTFRSFQVVANYQDFKGFYLENTEFVNPSRASGDPYYQRPDMHSTDASVLFTWILNPSQYSLEAATEQSVRQSSSGGSWLIGGSAARALFNDSSPLVPTQVAGRFGSDSAITSAEFTSLSVRGGYGYTFVYDTKWFVTGQGLLGLGPQFAHYSDEVTSHEDSRGVPKVNLLLSTGYNGDRFLSGVMIDLDSTDYRTASLEIPITLAIIKLYLGTRF